jgi:hypothetical protein
VNKLRDPVPFAVRREAGDTLKSSVKHEVSFRPFGVGALTIENELAGLGGGTSFFKNVLRYKYVDLNSACI